MVTLFERLSLRAKLVKSLRLIVDVDPRIINVEESKIVFAIPHGIDPDKLHDKSYVFRQVFGDNAELSGSLKYFTLTIPSKPMPRKVPYDINDWIPKIKSISDGVPIICGVNVNGDYVVFDIAKHPHLLVSGETGSGKSSLLRAIITALAQTQKPSELRLILGDLKRSEFGIFRRLPHVNSVDIGADSLLETLEAVESEMERRGDRLDEEEVSHIKSLKKPPPYWVVAIDEVALLRKEKRVLEIIENISSIGRSLGVLLILSMQRPDAKVLDGRLKNNLTVRISGRQSNKTNANVAGLPGAETIKQSQRGRMLIDLDGEIKRIQSPWIDEVEAKEILNPLKLPKGGGGSVDTNESHAVGGEEGADIIDFGRFDVRNERTSTED